MPDSGKKPYTRPEIIHEADLETRAGSPLGGSSPVDVLDPGGTGTGSGE